MSYSSEAALDGCGDGCGWVSALVAALAYGSFGVPIKYTKHIDVHPLVLQSFKTGTMFVLAWFVVFLHVTPSWTPWGCLSGLLWVLGGTGGIYAIRKAGLAIAVGTWASVMICVNFIWGILIFQEPVADIWGTLGAFFLLALGLVGMSHYSEPQKMIDSEEETVTSDVENVEEDGPTATTSNSDDEKREQLLSDADRMVVSTNKGGEHDKSSNNKQVFYIVGLGEFALSQRAAGIGGAIFNGLMTGSSLIPLHYAKKQGFGGAHYMISFATGALISNTVLWILFFAYNFYTCWKTRKTSTTPAMSDSSDGIMIRDGDDASLWMRTYQSMPAWHFSKLFLPGVAAGILLAIAMFGSILAVTYLGQGIGNSVVQSKILISGLWGIIWFGEIRGCATVSKWFLSASLTVGGIVWLSQERIAATGGH